MLTEFAAHQAKDAERKSGHVIKEADIKSFDGDLASYFLGYVLMYAPAWVTQKFDELSTAPACRLVVPRRQRHRDGLSQRCYEGAKLRRLEPPGHTASRALL